LKQSRSFKEKCFFKVSEKQPVVCTFQSGCFTLGGFEKDFKKLKLADLTVKSNSILLFEKHNKIG